MLNFKSRSLSNYISDGARIYLLAPHGERSLDVFIDAKDAVFVELFDCNDIPIGHASGSRYVIQRDLLAIPAGAAGPLSMYLSDDVAIRWAGTATPLVISLEPDALFEPSTALMADE